MGFSKREYVRHQELVEVARQLAVNTGGITTCPVHEDVYFDPWDSDAVEQALEAGQKMIANGELDATDAELETAMKKAVEETMIDDNCPYCSKD